MRQRLRRGGGRRGGPPSRSQRWGILGGPGNFDGGGSGGGALRAPWGLGSHGPNVSGGSVSEPAGAPAPPERKFCATSSETSDCRVQRGWGCNSEPQRLREAGEGSSRAEESRRDSRGGERGRGTSLAAPGPRCPRTEAKGRASRRPPQSRSCGRPGPLRYAPAAAGSLAAATPAPARSRCLRQPRRRGTGSWALRSRPDRPSAVSRLQTQLSAISGAAARREAPKLQRRCRSPDRTVPGLAARLPCRAGQPLGAGRRRRGPACSLERPDGNTL